MTYSPLLTGVSCLHYAWDSLPEAFARLPEWDLDMVEFSTTRLHDHDYREVGRLAEATGKLTSLHAWTDLAQLDLAEGVGECRQLLHKCRQMAATHLILHCGTHPQRAVGLDQVAAIVGKVAAEYEHAGVQLCLENHYPYTYRQHCELGGDPSDVLHVLRQVKSPGVRFCLDYGHSNMAGNTLEFIQWLSPYLAYTHIADNLGDHDDHLAPGEGTVNWPEVLAQTLRAGFRGPYVIEFPENDDPERFNPFLSLLRELAGNH